MKKTLRILLLLTLSSALFAQSHIKVGIPGSNQPNIQNELGTTKVVRPNSTNKISPLLKYTMEKAEKVKTSKAVSSRFSMNYFLTIRQNENKELMLPVFVKTNNASSLIPSIKNLGGEIQSVIKNIIVAEVPLSSVSRIAEFEGTIYIDASTLSAPLTDISSKEINADKVHNGNELPKSYKGENVILGVVDSGIDWKHDAFKTGAGNRILYLWDMSGAGNPPAGYTYGREYNKAKLDALDCQEIDGNDGHGHGTHVTGTAAGNKYADFTGIAPKSDIIFVKGFRESAGFADTDVINGCNYIFQKAKTLGKPAVINLSLGGHFGAHDGSSLYEQALSNLTGEGKIIVAAAGNEGGAQIHVGYAASGNKYEEANQTFWIIPENVDASLADLWYDSGNISVGIAAFDKNLNLLGYTAPIAPGQQLNDFSFKVDNKVYGLVYIDATTIQDPNNNSKRVLIMIDSNNGTYNLSDVYWTLYTYGSGKFDAWINLGGYFTTDESVSMRIKPGDNEKSVGMPATSKKVICTGSYVTKTKWVDIDGNTQEQLGEPVLYQRSSFSSMGPSRDGRLKPDISAPGEVIVAPLSSDVTISPNVVPRQNVVQGGKYQKMQGTSMATPHVTGTVALMLQAKPTLTYEEVFSILTSTAKKDENTTGNPNNLYGYGKLDAYQAVKSIAGTGPGPINDTANVNQDFEGSFPPAGWEIVSKNYNATWVKGNPQNNDFSTIDPSSTASAVCPWAVAIQDEWLITPSFSLDNVPASIEFYAGFSTAWLNSATLTLNISTDGGTNWIKLWEAEDDDQAWMWKKRTIDLSSYSGGQNLKAAWRYKGNNGDLVALDNIKIFGTQSATGIADQNEKIIPAKFNLRQNYPNPFNPKTNIQIELPEDVFISLKVYDVLGREITELAKGLKKAGVYTYILNANNLPSGTYFYRLKAGGFESTKKIILLK